MSILDIVGINCNGTIAGFLWKMKQNASTEFGMSSSTLGGYFKDRVEDSNMEYYYVPIYRANEWHPQYFRCALVSHNKRTNQISYTGWDVHGVEIDCDTMKTLLSNRVRISEFLRTNEIGYDDYYKQKPEIISFWHIRKDDKKEYKWNVKFSNGKQILENNIDSAVSFWDNILSEETVIHKVDCVSYGKI